jgi:hypothetical protein
LNNTQKITRKQSKFQRDNDNKCAIICTEAPPVYLKPAQDRRKELAARPEKITEIIRAGSRRARAVASDAR